MFNLLFKLSILLSVVSLASVNAHAVTVSKDKLYEDAANKYLEKLDSLQASDPNKKINGADAGVDELVQYLNDRLDDVSPDDIGDLRKKLNVYLSAVFEPYQAKVSSMTAAANGAELQDAFDGYKKSANNVVTASLKEWDESKTLSKTEKQVNLILSRIDKLNDTKKPKMLRPVKDIEFLYESVIGEDEYIYKKLSENDEIQAVVKPVAKDFKSIVSLQENTAWYQSLVGMSTFSVKYKDLNDQPKSVDINHAQSLKLKLAAVEDFLNVSTEDTTPLVDRIETAYTSINNTDWETDNIRFGVMLSSVKDAETIATSAAINAYFGYRRFMPESFDFGRRLSFLFAMGVPTQSAGTGGVEGPIYTVGLGFDIDTGILLNVGYSVYSYRAMQNSAFSRDASVTMGVTLNSDLWKGFNAQ